MSADLAAGSPLGTCIDSQTIHGTSSMATGWSPKPPVSWTEAPQPTGEQQPPNPSVPQTLPVEPFVDGLGDMSGSQIPKTQLVPHPDDAAHPEAEISNDMMAQWMREGAEVKASTPDQANSGQAERSEDDDKYTAALRHVAQTKQPPPARGIIGWRFNDWIKRHASKEEKAKYAKCKTRDGKAHMRQRFALKEWEVKRLEWRESESWSTVDITLGEYMSPDAVVVEQGGWSRPDAVRRGLNIVQSCCKLGGEFLRYNTQSKAYDVLRIKVQHQDVWARKCATSDVEKVLSVYVGQKQLENEKALTVLPAHIISN